MNLSLRDQTPADEPFLRRLLLDTIAEQLDADGWPEPMRSHLLGIQADSRLRSRRAQFPAGRSSIVSIDGADAGWLYVAALDDEVRLVDVVIDAVYRGRVAGAALLRDVISEARAAGKPVRLAVEVRNPAVRLYERLGFVRRGGDEIHHEFECR